jgi:hypothetical protein
MTPTPHERVEALYAGRPTGQTVRVTARALTNLGGKPGRITVEFDLPDNAAAVPDGARELVESAFHLIFGRTAKHVDADGEVTPDLREAIEVEIIGEADEEASEEAKAELARIAEDAVKGAKQRGLKQLMDSAIITPPDGPSLN